MSLRLSESVLLWLLGVALAAGTVVASIRYMDRRMDEQRLAIGTIDERNLNAHDRILAQLLCLERSSASQSVLLNVIQGDVSDIRRATMGTGRVPDAVDAADAVPGYAASDR